MMHRLIEACGYVFLTLLGAGVLLIGALSAFYGITWDIKARGRP